MSLPEVLLWQELRKNRPPQPKWRRQHPFGPYILDFCCVAAGFCVEVDGAGHGEEDKQDADDRRDAFLRERGVRTMRVRAWRVLDSPEYVAERLDAWAVFLTEQRRR